MIDGFKKNGGSSIYEELKAALSKVKTLSGLLHICSNCKKIRDDKGYWNHLEDYLNKRSDAELTHSICPACLEKLYAEFLQKSPADGEKEDNARNSGCSLRKRLA